MDRFTAEKRLGPVYASATGQPVAGASGAGADAKPGAAKASERLGTKLWNAVMGNTESINNLLYFTVRDTEVRFSLHFWVSWVRLGGFR